MPSEVRNIYFTEFELISALVSFSKIKKVYIDKSDVNSVIIGNNGQVDVSLLVKKPHSDKTDIMDYSNAEVAAALIAFCMRNSIPLPRDSEKLLLAKGDKVLLSIKMENHIY